MIIREALKEDLKVIREIWNHNIEETTVNFDYEPKSVKEVEEWFKTKNSQGFPVFVADQNGEVAGYASYGTFRGWEGYKYAVEHSIYTHNDFQRIGVGKALIEHMILDAKNEGYRTMIGCIDAKNINSIHFHHKFGFESVGKMKDIGFKFGKWLDCIFVQLIL